ncbi:hypothetical protein Tco_1041579 [Tanacetum coccineum]|uniref:Reverse transcriptase Ty1/copia-type domain-containing protein n=1 Tax=Tanacetum coccineum TaxID=301880 RepID=A0ABQ5GI71_9ASTR
MYEKKIKFMEQPTGPAPDPETVDPDTIDKYYETVNLEQEVACLMLSKQAKHELFETVEAFHTCKQEEGQSVSSYLLKMKSYLDTLERLGYAMPNEPGVSLILNSLNKDYDQFVQNYNMHSMGKTIVELHAMLKLHEKGIPKKAETPAVLAIREGKIQKDKKKPRGAKGKEKGKDKLAYAPKPKIPPPPKRDNPTKDFVCHHFKEVGHWKRNFHQSPRGIFISQSQYAIKLLKKHGMDEFVFMSTSITTERLDADLQGTPTDQMTYRRMIGGLVYLTASRPDIAFATFVCACYQERPMDFGFELIAYSEADYAGCKDDCKSTSGSLQFLGKKLMSWSSIKQDCTAMSTAKADAIAITCNPVQHSRTKHIDIRYHFIKEHVEKGTVEIYFVRTEYQLADLFTKAFAKECFEYLVHHIGMRCVTATQLESLAKLSS